MDTPRATPVIEAFSRYAQAFRSLDPRAMPAHFHEPALMITPDGVHALPDPVAVERLYARIMAELPAMGYARTAFSPLEERRLGKELSVLTGSGSWVDSAGKKLNSFGLTYTLRRTDQGWRIVTAIIHDPQ